MRYAVRRNNTLEQNSLLLIYQSKYIFSAIEIKQKYLVVAMHAVHIFYQIYFI